MIRHQTINQRSFPGEIQSNTRSPAADDPQFQPCKPSDFFYFSQDVADPQSTMVRRPLATPGVDEGRGFESESQPAIRVADFQPLPGQRFTLSRQEFKPAIARLCDCQDGDRAFVDAGFNANAMTAFPVV